MTEWHHFRPATIADVHAFQRCTNPRTLDDIATCFNGCDCDECRAGESAAASGVVDLAGAATPPAAFSEDEDAAYERWLTQSGRDPKLDPTLQNRPPRLPQSEEVLRHVVEKGEQAEERLRQAGYDPDNLPGRAYSDEWTPEEERLWQAWQEFKR